MNLISYLKDQKGKIIILSLLVLGGTSLNLINPQIMKKFIDSAETAESVDPLIWLAIFFIVIALFTQCFKLAASYIGQIIAWNATNKLREDLTYHCLNLDMAFHKKHKPGELIERVDGDVNFLSGLFSRMFVDLASNFLLLIGVLALLWAINWQIGLTITIVFAIGLLFLNRMNRIMVKKWGDSREVSSELFGSLEEWLNGTEEIQTSAGGSFILNKLYVLLRKRWKTEQKAFLVNMPLMVLPTVILGFAYISAYYWGSTFYYKTGLSIGTIYLSFYYIDRLTDPLWTMQRQLQELMRAKANIIRIKELLMEQPTIKDGNADKIPSGSLDVEFRNLTFAYENTNILNDISFKLEAGKKLGLLGRTGSGKTTITKLLYRFYQPQSGGIFLGSGGEMIDIRESQKSEICHHIGMVTQDVELFNASLRDNITVFNPSIDDSEIIEAISHSGLKKWFDKLPKGLDTNIEGGKNLSAGEAQLIALVRVFLKDPGLVIL
ncbi:MAG: ABC transporter ATP-binding protein, partial [Deltaproteobacteria bacterium]|nr:ABC transporter ATP-binding protein [Deltaproteobacteria bacterium]